MNGIRLRPNWHWRCRRFAEESPTGTIELSHFSAVESGSLDAIMAETLVLSERDTDFSRFLSALSDKAISSTKHESDGIHGPKFAIDVQASEATLLTATTGESTASGSLSDRIAARRMSQRRHFFWWAAAAIVIGHRHHGVCPLREIRGNHRRRGMAR